MAPKQANTGSAIIFNGKDGAAVVRNMQDFAGTCVFTAACPSDELLGELTAPSLMRLCGKGGIEFKTRADKVELVGLVKQNWKLILKGDKVWVKKAAAKVDPWSKLKKPALMMKAGELKVDGSMWTSRTKNPVILAALRAVQPLLESEAVEEDEDEAVVEEDEYNEDEVAEAASGAKKVEDRKKKVEDAYKGIMEAASSGATVLISSSGVVTVEEEDEDKDGEGKVAEVASARGLDRNNIELLFDLMVQMPTGKTITLKVEANDTIDNVKKQIQELEAIPPAQQCLTFTGKLMKNGKRISSYGIKANDTIKCTREL